jgi:hypothetical protein
MSTDGIGVAGSTGDGKGLHHHSVAVRRQDVAVIARLRCQVWILGEVLPGMVAVIELDRSFRLPISTTEFRVAVIEGRKLLLVARLTACVVDGPGGFLRSMFLVAPSARYVFNGTARVR